MSFATAGELSSHLQSGETLAEIAREQNVSADTVIEAIVAPFAEQFNLRVRYGYLTQEQADTLLETAYEHAVSLLEQNLSGTGGNAEGWQEMEEYCGNMMGNYDGSTGYGGMMGGGMMGGGMMGGGMMGGGMMGGHTFAQDERDFLDNLGRTLWIAGLSGAALAIFLGYLFTR